MTSTIEETAASQTGTQPAEPKQPKGTKAATKRAQKPRVAPGKGKAGKKATPSKKAPKGGKGAKPAKGKGGVRAGSKTDTVLELLKRPGGATLAEIMKATSWQAHSVRGFISGTVGKKMDLPVASFKNEAGERAYRIEK